MKLFFGPNHRYFFDDGKGNFKYRAPPNFLDLFRTVRIKEIHHVAFGVGDSFFVSYTRADFQHLYHFQHDNHYGPLKSWLFDEGLNHGNTAYVSLGLNDAFFAASSQGHRWRNIPVDVCDYYQQFTRQDLFIKSRVNTIDLGFDDTFLGIGIDNTWFWDLKSHYPHLEGTNISKRIRNATFVMINPYAPDQHFITFEDGTAHYSLPPEWAPDVANLFQQYAAQTTQHAPAYGATYAGYSSATTSYPTTFSPQSPPPFQSPPPPLQHSNSFSVNDAMSLGNNVLDAYNNTTNAIGGGGGGGGWGGQTFDVNQAMGTMQSSVDAINNVTGYAGQSIDMVNQVTNTGLMVGQLGMTAAASACVVM